MFVEDPAVSESLKVHLERFQFDAAIVGDVRERQRPEIGLAGLGTDAGEFRTDDFDGIVAPRVLVGERLQRPERLARHPSFNSPNAEDPIEGAAVAAAARLDSTGGGGVPETGRTRERRFTSTASHAKPAARPVQALQPAPGVRTGGAAIDRSAGRGMVPAKSRQTLSFLRVKL